MQCLKPRQEGSFFHAPSMRRKDICKSCIFRPNCSASLGLDVIRGRTKRTQTAFADLLKQEQANGQSLVYLAQAGRDMKIGFSGNVTQRLLNLSTGSAFPIQLIAVVPGGRQLEQELHTEFDSLRTHREWFRDKGRAIVTRFSTIPGAMIFLPEYLSSDPLLGVTE